MNHKKMNTVGQQAGSTLKDQLSGTWMLVSIYNEREDGSKFYPLGANPTCFVMLDGNGRFSLQLIASGLPKFASNNRDTGAPDENKAVVQGSLFYFGTYSMGADGTLGLEIEGSSFPNWTHVNQMRMVTTLTKSEVKWTNPVASTGGTAEIAWKRTK